MSLDNDMCPYSLFLPVILIVDSAFHKHSVRHSTAPNYTVLMQWLSWECYQWHRVMLFGIFHTNWSETHRVMLYVGNRLIHDNNKKKTFVWRCGELLDALGHYAMDNIANAEDADTSLIFTYKVSRLRLCEMRVLTYYVGNKELFETR